MDTASEQGVSRSRQRAIAAVVVFGVAVIHLASVGALLPDTPRRLYASYASDVLVPLAMYFVLCLSARLPRVLADWKTKALAVFAAASLAETLQALGVPALGRTFDPLDFVMYAGGVLTAVLIDRVAWRALRSRGGGDGLS